MRTLHRSGAIEEDRQPKRSRRPPSHRRRADAEADEIALLGEGMRRLVRETCDLLVTLPMRGKVGSLNVATVGSVALYAAWQAREWQGWTPPK